LIVPCEVAVKTVVPAVKALLATELVNKHGLKQEDVADLLGISQSAVSKYTRKIRGHIIEINKVGEMQSLITQMVTLIVDGNHQRAQFLTYFCKTCTIVRKTSLMCEFCAKTDPNLEIDECKFCLR
jgi:predicted transcriptional regulator